MNWYYVELGKQAGPVDDARLEELRRSGKIQSETLVWHEGMANWAPYREAKPEIGAEAHVAPPIGEAASTPPVATDAMCTECGKMFPPDQMIRYGNAHVCAGCKPVFMQKLAEGATLGQLGGNLVTEEQLLQREYRIDLGDAITRAWNVFTKDVGTVILTFLLWFLAFLGCWFIGAVVSVVIPFGNLFMSALYSAPLSAGILWFTLRMLRGEPAALGDAFSGFTKYGQLVLFGLMECLILIVSGIPLFVMGVGFGISGAFRSAAMTNASVVGFGLGMLVAVVIFFCILAYLSTLFTFSTLLIMDKGYRFWPAMMLSRRMVNKRWWMTFLFLFVAGIIASCGIMLCLVGLLVTGPLYAGMKVALYNDNFRDLAPQS